MGSSPVVKDWRTEHYGPRGRYVPWLWHALFDGTWLCHCPRSRDMKKHRLRDYNERGFNGF